MLQALATLFVFLSKIPLFYWFSFKKQFPKKMKILSLKNEENVRTMSCKQNLLGLTKKDCVSFVNNNEHYQTAQAPPPPPKTMLHSAPSTQNNVPLTPIYPYLPKIIPHTPLRNPHPPKIMSLPPKITHTHSK